MKKSLGRVLSLVLSIALLMQPITTSALANDGTLSHDEIAASAEPGAATEQVVDSGTAPDAGKEAVMIGSFAPLTPDVAVMEIPVGAQLSDITPELPQTLTAADVEGKEIVIDNITWQCDAFKQDCAVGDVFTAVAALPQGYALAENVSAPSIELHMIESLISPFAINDRVIVDHVIYKEFNSTEAQLIGVTSGFSGGAVVVPSKVTTASGKELTVVGIEADAFKGVETLNSITIGDAVQYLGKQAFSGCKALATVNISASVKDIRERAFENCSALRGITIPDTVETVGNYAFSGAGLESFTVPAGLVNIGERAFASSNLTTIRFADGITEIKSSYISGSATLKTVEFSENITSIADYAFTQCSALETIIIPDTVTSIGAAAFYYCTKLKEVTLPNGLTAINTSLFYECISLASITIPNSVTEIGYNAFQNCTSLAAIIIPDSVTDISSAVFYNCTKLTSVTLPKDLTTISSSLFDSCSSLASITIPESVKSINSSAFSYCTSLAAITIPDSVTGIGYNAFQNCTSLAAIIIPDSVTSVDYQAFYNCTKLASVTLSKNLTSISQRVFYNCTSLAAVTIPASVTAIISEAFYNCTKLASVTLPKNLTSIGQSAFWYCTALESIEIPAGVTSIGLNAFRGCTALTSIAIPDSVVSIGSSAFGGCTKLASVTLPNKLTTLNYGVFSSTALSSISIPSSVTTLYENVFAQCSKLTAIEVLGTLASVARTAFGGNDAMISVPNVQTAEKVRDSGVKIEKIKLADGNDHGLIPTTFVLDGGTYTVTAENKVTLVGLVKSLTQFAIPQSVLNSGIQYQVTSIKEQALFSCASLTSISIPDTVTSIGAEAFSGCTSLTSISIPDTVTSIGAEAFSGCTSLTSITIPDSVSRIERSVFSSCSALESVTIPESVTVIGDYAFSSCVKLASVELPEGLTTIGNYAFTSCKSLTSIAIPDSVTSIGYYAFQSCSGLTAATLPKGITSVSDGLFQYCSLLGSITIPDKVTSISNYTFQGCSGLKSVTLPSSLGYIGVYAFNGCTSLTSIAIPDNVYSIGQGAFQGCSGLTSIALPQTVYSIGISAFAHCTSLKSATVLGGLSASSYSNIFGGCSALESVTIGGNATGVPAEMFRGRSSLKNLVLGENVQQIGAYAFAGTSIPHVEIPDSTTHIGERAFEGCTDLGYAKIGSGLTDIGIKAFPITAQLIANDPRVQLLLVKYLSQDEDKRPATSWNGTSNIAADAIAATDKEITVSGNVSIAKGAQLTVLHPIIVTGTLTIGGSVTIGKSGMIIVAGSGSVVDNGANNLALHYTITVPEFVNGSVRADKPFATAGEQITLTVEPETDFRLKKDSLKYNDTVVTEKNAVYQFTMPDEPITIDATFEDAYISGVTIVADGSTTLSTGSTVTLSAQPVPNDTSADEIVYSWSASVPDAVILSGADSADVTVEAKAIPRDTVVTLTVLAKHGTVTRVAKQEIVVLHEAIESIHILPEALRVNRGVNQKFSMVASPAGTDAAFSWHSSNPEVATVDADGVVTTKLVGVTVIHAQAGGVRSNEVSVEVVDEITYATDVVLSPNPLSLAGGESASVAAEIAPLNATVRGTWSSSQPAVATVDVGGQVKALTKGTALISYTIQKSATENIVKTVSVVVNSVQVSDVTINERPVQQFRPGDTLPLTASVKPSTATDQTLSWISSNSAVATVSQQGVVTLRGAGDVTITAASISNPTKTSAVQLSVVVDVTGTLTFSGAGKAAYKNIEVTKDGGEPILVYSDSNGAFRCPALAAGGYLVTSEPNAAGYRTLSQRFTIEQGSGTPVWSLEYSKSRNGTITAGFKDTAGSPVAGVRATVQSEAPYQYKAGYSNGQGQIVFEGLVYDDNGTEFTVSYSTEDGAYGSQTAKLKANTVSQQISVTLPSVSTINGKIQDERGVGLPSIYVQVGKRGAYTGNDGRYSIRGQLDPGKYTVELASWEKYIAKENPQITVTAGSTVQVPAITVTNGISVSGRFLLDGQISTYQKAYIMLHRDDGTYIAGSYASGNDGYIFESAIKSTGTYKLTVSNVYDLNGDNFLDYDALVKTFSVSSMSQSKVVMDLDAKTKLKTSEIFTGDNNVLASDVSLVQAGGKFDLHGKYKNNSSQTVTATFQTTLHGSLVDPSYAGTQYGQTTHIVTLKPGEAGRFLIKALASTDARAISASTTVTVNGQTSDFARISLEVANVSLSVKSTSIAIGESFQVFGEATLNSRVMIYDQDNKLLGNTQILPGGGRWFSIELNGFPTEGTYSIYANCDAGTEVATSEKLELHVSAAPVSVQRVTVDQLIYEDIPVNSRTGIRTFSHTVDNSLRPDPLDVRTTFANSSQIAAVTYHFAGLDFAAEHSAGGSWYASIGNWRGTGIKPLSATVKMSNGKLNEFMIAEVVVLIDPSGYVTDADTGNPLPGTQVSCFIKNANGSYSLWDNERYAQPNNPSYTDNSGHYGWMVPDGTYRVSAAKAGYENGDSTAIDRYHSGIDVPPPAMDVNFEMVPTTPMSLLEVGVAGGAIDARFSRHVKSASVTVQDSSGKTVATSVTINKNRVTISGSFASNTKYTVYFASVLSKSGTAPEYQLSGESAAVTFGELGDNTVDPPTGNTGGGSGNGSGGGSGGSYSSSFFDWLFPLDLSLAKINAAPRSGLYAVMNISGSDKKITGKKFANAMAALKPGEKLILRQNGANQRTQYQFAINPATLTILPESLHFGATLNDKNAKALFEKSFNNKVQVIELNHKGSFGFTADLAVDFDVSQWNTKNLIAYSYNAKTNQYTYLPSARPYVDAKNFVHLSISQGGTIVLTDGPLVKK